MKYTASNFASLLEKCKKSQVASVLLYGPDKGLISHIVSTISKNAQIKAVSYRDVQNFESALNNRNLFGLKEIVKIYDTPQAIDSDLKSILAKGVINFPIFIADELSTSSSTRKFFEEQSSLASYGCYPEDENAIANLLRQQILANHKKITQDALIFFTKNIAGDRLLILNEIDKLLLFSQDIEIIDIKCVESIVSKGIVSSSDKLCISFAKSDATQYLEELERLKSENIPLIWIIKALQRYYISLYIVRTDIERGSNIESAIKLLRPPIFFKYLNDFKRIVASKTMTQIILTIQHLAETETQLKNGINENVCELLFWKCNKYQNNLSNN